jgi:hypothetical protein
MDAVTESNEGLQLPETQGRPTNERKRGPPWRSHDQALRGGVSGVGNDGVRATGMGQSHVGHRVHVHGPTELAVALAAADLEYETGHQDQRFVFQVRSMIRLSSQTNFNSLL